MGATRPRPGRRAATVGLRDAGAAPEFGVLAPADARAGLALSHEAGWNQTVADWDHFLRRGTVYGARDTAGRVVGTAALLPYGRGEAGSAAWISLVLVTPAHRGCGLATALVERCLDEARRLDLRPHLDATPDGATVYQALDFVPGDELLRLRRPARAGVDAPSEPGHLDALLTLERAALGIDRSDLLRALAARPGSALHGGSEAACLVRAGRRARHVGPVYACSTKAALDLLSAVTSCEGGELVIDLLAHHEGVRTALFERGFAFERPFTRMAVGAVPALPDLAIAGAGPEYG